MWGCDPGHATPANHPALFHFDTNNPSPLLTIFARAGFTWM
jgi:hypothetical protein